MLLHLGLNVITFRTLLHLGPNVITFRTLLHLGPNVITFRTLLHLGQLLHLGLQQAAAECDTVILATCLCLLELCFFVYGEHQSPRSHD